jgi:poly(hydroxyalkanoate) depolymerase family esterase
MQDLRTTISRLARYRRTWRELMQGAKSDVGLGPDIGFPRLNEVHGFGSNPGNLRMFTHVPARLAENPALLLVLHGCTQSAASYNHGAGWSALADRYGFALVLPEQQRSNNPKTCFTWYLPSDIARDRGEALSIRQMVERAASDNGIDPSRVYITGLSAGGAMTSVMLACYPELFAGGAIIAGLPYSTAHNVQQAFESMFQVRSRSAREWGDLVRSASSHRGPWPRISLWHGSADKTVVPGNVGELIKQWTNVHGLPLEPSWQEVVSGYPRRIWTNAAGDELIESYSITDMAHGTPLSTSDADGSCGNPAPFLLDVGISSSYHIARFFGLSNELTESAKCLRTGATRPDGDAVGTTPISKQPPILSGEVLGRNDTNEVRDEATVTGHFDIEGVIKRALRAAGLVKS